MPGRNGHVGGAAAALCVIALGALLRVHGFDLSWTNTDQTRDLARAFAVAAGREFPLLGPAVGATGFCLGPLYYYLLAAPAALARSPEGIYLFVAAISILSLWVFYRVARGWCGGAAAFFALVPYAFSAPWVIRGQYPSNPTIMPIFVILFWASVVSWAADRRPWGAAGAMACIAVLLQLHLSTAVFIPLALLSAFLLRPPVRAGALASGAAAAFLICLPYLAHESRHGWGNTLGLLDLICGAPAGAPASRGGIASDLAAWFAAGPRFASELAPGGARWYRLFLAGNILAAAGAAAALVNVAARAARRGIPREARVRVVLLVWLAGTIAPALGRRGGVWIYYLDAACPAPFIFFGIFLAALWDMGARKAAFPASTARAETGVMRGSAAARPAALLRAAARAAIVAYLAFLAALNSSVLLRFRAETARLGVVRLPGFWLNIRSMRTWARERHPYIRNMPARYRKALAERFVLGDGLGYAECARRIHGTGGDCFLEDKGFWIAWFDGMIRRPGRAARGAGGGGLEYMIEAPGMPIEPPPGASSRARAGPFEIIGFAPAVRVSSLSARGVSGAPLGTLDIPTGAAGFALPTASPVYRYWTPAFIPGAKTAVLEGALEAGDYEGDAALCVAIRSSGPVAVRDPLLDGEALPLRGLRHLKTLTRTSVYSYRLPRMPRGSLHRLRLTLSSRAPIACDVDVYGYPCAPAGGRGGDQ